MKTSGIDKVLILYPVIALVSLTLWVTARLYFVQRRATKRQDVKYGFFRVYQGDRPEYLQAARDHYKNMFELPILFYAWAIIIYASGGVDGIDLTLAWLFVTSRFVHSFIRATDHTRVLYRLSAFSAGWFMVLFSWAKLAIQTFLG